ncbi:MAG: energy transducer TonB [Gemmatimonadota bacterium]
MEDGRDIESGAPPEPEGLPELEGLLELERAVAKEHMAYRRALAAGVAVSIALHVLVLFVVLPRFSARISASVETLTELVRLPPAEDAYEIVPPVVELPDLPPLILRPAMPMAAPVEEPEWVPPFIPHDTPPKLMNTGELVRLLEAGYPTELKEEGIEGVVLLWLFIDEAGRPVKLQLRRSSGFRSLDRIAQDVADQMRFRPAYNQDRPVGVWVAQQIRFEFQFADLPEEGQATSADSS